MKCCVCSLTQNRIYFTKSQWKNGATKRTCRACQFFLKTDPLKSFNKWVKIRDESPITTNSIGIKQFKQSSHRGVYATKTIKPDTVLLRVPLKKMLTLTAARAHVKAKYPTLECMYHPCLALFLLHHVHLGESSFFAPYIAMLPTNFNYFLIMEENTTTNEALQGSLLQDMIKARVQLLHSQHRAIKHHNVLFSEREYIWASTIVITRCFGFEVDDDPNTPASYSESGLVPVADMLNHAKNQSTIWGYEQGHFCIRAHSTITVSREIFDTYGHKCNSRFFINYGFLLEDNEEYNQAVIFLQPEFNISQTHGINFDSDYSGYNQLILTHEETKVRVKKWSRFMLCKFSLLESHPTMPYVKALFSILRYHFAHLAKTQFEDRGPPQSTGAKLSIYYDFIESQVEVNVLQKIAERCKISLQYLQDTENRKQACGKLQDGTSVVRWLEMERGVLQYYVRLAKVVTKSWERSKSQETVYCCLINDKKFRAYAHNAWKVQSKRITK